MKKIKLENQGVGPFPAMIVGAMMNGKPTYTLAGAGGCACHEPVLCVSLKNTHYITSGIVQSGYFSMYIDDDCITDNQPDPLKIDPVIMMAFNYLNIKSVIGRPFTEGKKLKMKQDFGFG